MKLRKSFLILLTTSFIGTHSFADDAVYDPAEPVNRAIFSFNETADQYVLGPVAHGYDAITPDRVQVGVTNFFKNLRYPTYLLSDIVQLKFGQAAEHTGRFLINTTIGIGGLVDVAKHIGLEDKEEDSGLAFASYGMGPGPYIVLPFLGPSNLRDTVGFVLDSFTNPLYLFSLSNAHSDAKQAVWIGGTALKVIQTRVNLDDAIKASREGSLDPYTFMQSSYYQYRNGLVDGTARQEGEPATAPTGNDSVDADMDAILQGGAGGSAH